MKLVLVRKLFEGLKRRLGAWKEPWESEGLRANVKKTKVMIRSENAGKITVKGKFSWAVCRKVVESNSILCQSCRCWVHMRCSGIRDKLKEDNKFVWTKQLIDIAEDCPGIWINGQSLETKEKFCFLGNTRKRIAVDNFITNITSGWSRFRNLVP